MAITGEFLSDFNDFVRGAKSADDMLAKMEGRSTTFGSAWESALKEADFERLMNQPIKTGVGLAKDFAGALGPIGQAAVIGAAGVTALGSALWGLALATAETAANLGDMADKTGISVPALSRLESAAEVAGTDIGTLSNAIYGMQLRMANDPRAFEQGLKRIGLEFSAFQALNPDEQLMAIADGLRAQVDPVERAAAGTGLLGKQYRDMGPALLDVAEAMELTKGVQPFTAEDAANAEALQMQWAALKLEIKGIGQEIGTAVTPAFLALVQAVREGGAVLKGFWDSTKKEAENLDMILDGLATGGITLVAPEVAKIAQRQGEWNAQIASTAAQAPTLEQGLAALKELTKDNAKHLAESEAAAKKFQLAMEELDSAGQGWKGTLLGIDGEIVDAVKYYLDAGVSQSALATAYGLTATQIKAVSSALADEAKILKEQTALKETMWKRELELTKLLQAENTKLADQRKGEIEAALRREADAQVALNTAMGLTATGAIPQVVSALGTYETKMKEIDKMRVAGFSTTAQENLAAYELQQGLLAEARATDQVVEATGKVPGVMDKAKNSMGAMKDEAVKTAGALSKLMPGMGGMIPAGAAQTAFGSSLVPQYGASGFIGMGTPTAFTGQPLYGGAGGFIGSGVNVTINGSVLSNKNEIARVVGDAVTSSYRQGGNRLG